MEHMFITASLILAASTMIGQRNARTFASRIPKFNNTPEHVTVVEGSRVILPCSVGYLGKHHVLWENPKQTLISLDDRRIIDDHRISVERPYIKAWNLLIRDVRYNDSGTYECRINTDPIQIKKVTLEVQVPQTILSQQNEIVLEEGQTATLICNVTGNPQPNVTWYRLMYSIDGGRKERIGLEGEVLIIHNVTRLYDGIYECVADNGVPPAVSKAIRVSVDYPPEVTISNPNGIGQSLGKDTILECHISAHPQAMINWMRNGEVLRTNYKYDIQVFKNDVKNSIELALRIRGLTPSDYGRYECIGSNFLGEASESIMLYEIKAPTTTTTAATTTRQRPTVEGQKGANTGLVYPDDRYPHNLDRNDHSGHPELGEKGSSDRRGEEKENKTWFHAENSSTTLTLSAWILISVALVWTAEKVCHNHQ